MGSVQISLAQLFNGISFIALVLALLIISWRIERGKRRNYEKLVMEIGKPKFYHLLAKIAAEKWAYALKEEANYFELRGQMSEDILPKNTSILETLEYAHTKVQESRLSYNKFIELVCLMGFKVTPKDISDHLRFSKPVKEGAESTFVEP